MRRSTLFSAAFFFSLLLVSAQEQKAIVLPKPQTEGGKPLMQALKERSSGREFSTRELPPQVLSNLLWAACGINRPDSGKRTAPSASNRQEIDIYVATASGLYLYSPKEHQLDPVLPDDIRASTGRQDFVKEVPVNLVYVADFAKMGNSAEADKIFYSAANTGFIGQNVYLYCASEGLVTVIRGMVDRPALAKTMQLRPDQRVILSQSIGYPAR